MVWQHLLSTPTGVGRILGWGGGGVVVVFFIFVTFLLLLGLVPELDLLQTFIFDLL